MSAQPRPHLTPEQYLELERASEFRHEYYRGRMYAMAGGSFQHALILSNLSAAIKKGQCIVTTSDLRVQVSPEGFYTYPDLVAICGEPKLLDGRRDTLLNPSLVVEVLSPSTEANDRGFKAAQYRTLDSLQEYAFVSQTEPRVEVFRRQPHGEWLLVDFVGKDAVCTFESVGANVPLAEIYDKVVFDAAEPLHPADE